MDLKSYIEREKEKSDLYYFMQVFTPSLYQTKVANLDKSASKIPQASFVL